MRLSLVVIFLIWSAVFCLLAVADPPLPGILVRLSDKGIKYAARKVMEWVDVEIDQGMSFPDLKGTFSPSFGSVEYVMTDIQARNFRWHSVSSSIVPDAGVMVSFQKIAVSVNGNFRYNYTILNFPIRNRGTFNFMLTNVSLSVNATAGMGSDGEPTVEFSSCSASVGKIDLQFKAESANAILSFFTDTIKNNVKPALIGAICEAVKNGQNLVARKIAENLKPCVDRLCSFLIDLKFVALPVFGKDLMETAHRGGIFWKLDANLNPLEALPFQRLPLSSKMVDLYVNVYVLNTLLYALYRNDFLSYVFTKDNLPRDYQNVMETSCENFCIGKILPGVFRGHPETAVELDVVATRAPFLKISDKTCSISFGGEIKMQGKTSDKSVMAMGILTLEGSLSASAFINDQGKIAFMVTDIRFMNVSIREKEMETDEGNDLISLLHSAAVDYLLPKLNEFGKKGFSIPSFGKINAGNSSLTLIENALVLMTDVIYADSTAV